MGARMSKHFNFTTIIAILAVSTTSAVAGEKAKPNSNDSEKVIITIIDTGIDLKNKELVKRLWKNPGESGVDVNGKDRSTNGIDDDGNGFVDDLHGWNFFNNTKNIQDHHGHGTHIAGIIYKELKKLKLENQVRFQILKYYDSETPSMGLLGASNQSLQYALNHGTQLVNYSGGGYEPNKDEEKLIGLLKQKNIPLIAAVGNQNLNTDLNPFYPASYGQENIFAIGAATQKQTPAPFSNYGLRVLDFLTPGVQIESDGLDGTKTNLSGTSQSTATASALVAYLMFQENGQTNWTELKQKLKSLRNLSLAKNKKGNKNYVDVPFIQKYKTTNVDAFGEP